MLEVSAGIVIEEGKILCMQRGQSKYRYISNKYEFPGGKIEAGEEPKTALIREFEEELNADISSSQIDLIGEINHNYPDFSIKMFVFTIKTSKFSFTKNEHLNHKWVQPDELSKLDWAEADKQVIERMRGSIVERI